jgi:gas vesicle protein
MAGSERDDEVMADEGEEGPRGLGRFGAGLVCGLLLGAGLALLFAPERGDRTRRRLRHRLERLREGTAEGISRADSLRRELQRRRESR